MRGYAVIRLGTTLLVILPSVAAAQPYQPYPTRPIRLIVAFPPGGGTDIVARIISVKLTEEFKQQVIVDNRAGADGIIGADIAAKANPDGHVIFIGTAGNLAINPSLYPKLPFNMARDFVPISQIVSVDMLLTVHPGVPAKTPKELIALAKSKPGALNYGSTGIGGIPHLAVELFKHMADVKMNHIPYKGGGPALVELIAGHVQAFVQSVVQATPPIRDARVRALAVLSPKRAVILPDVPLMADTLPGFDATNWYGVVVPARTPAPIQQRIHGAFTKVIRMPDVESKIVGQGATPVTSNPTEFAAFLKSETAKWAKVIQSANVRVE